MFKSKLAVATILGMAMSAAPSSIADIPLPEEKPRKRTKGERLSDAAAIVSAEEKRLRRRARNLRGR